MPSHQMDGRIELHVVAQTTCKCAHELEAGSLNNTLINKVSIVHTKPKLILNIK